jgi:hypothetical protein
MPAAEHALPYPRGPDGVSVSGDVATEAPHAGTHALRRATSLRTGMRFDPLMPIDAWKALGARIAVYSDATSWWLGDWLAYGQMKYGRRYKEGIAATGLEYQTLRNYAVVARRFDLSRRRDNLSFQHHAEVCALDDQEQDFWLDAAADGRWSRTLLRDRVRAARERPEPSRPPIVVRLVVDLQREQHWRDAAQENDQELDGWIRDVLDREAAAVLECPPLDAAV